MLVVSSFVGCLFGSLTWVFFDWFDLANPRDLHLLATTILEEELFGNDSVGVLSTKIDVPGGSIHQWLAPESMPCTFGKQVNFQINTIVYDDVQLVLELLNFVSLADNIDNLLLVGFQDPVALDDLPNAILVLGESSEFSVDARLVRNANLLVFVS